MKSYNFIKSKGEMKENAKLQLKYAFFFEFLKFESKKLCENYLVISINY